MCILCVSRGGARQLVRQGASALSGWAGEAAAPCSRLAAASTRAFSSLPDPVGPPPSAHDNVRDGKVAHPELLNEDLRKAQYAVRGELYNAALKLQQAGRELIFTNGGPLGALWGQAGRGGGGHARSWAAAPRERLSAEPPRW